jgi:hypothetical protein
MKKVYADSVPIELMKTEIENDFFKVRHYRVFVFYLVFISCLVGLLWSNNRVNLVSEESSYFIMNSALGICQYDQFRQINSVPDFYKWLRGLITTVYPLGSQPGKALSAPIGFMLVRQMRSLGVPCPDAAVDLLSNSTKPLRLTQYSCREDSEVDLNPYGDPNNQWKPGGTARVAKTDRNAFNYPATIYSFNDPNSEFATPFYYNTSWVNRSNPASVNAAPPYGNVTTALAEVRRMEKFEWIDEQTRIVSVDMLFYSKGVDRYTRVSLTVEQTLGGALVLSKYGHTFKVVAFGDPGTNFSFVVDLILFFYTFLLSIDMVYLARTRYLIHESITKSWGFWDILNAMLILLLWVAFGFRMQLWNLSRQIGDTLYAGMAVDEAQNTMLSLLYVIGQKFETSYNALSLALLPGATKILMYFQSVKGLNVVSLTIKSCVTDLAGLSFISATLFALFSCVATIFFGTYSIKYATVSNSFSTLVRMIISANIDDFDILVDAAPRVTIAFFATAFFLLWLVVLNLMVGVIVTAFAQAQQSQALTENLETLSEVFQKYFLLKGGFYKEDIRLKPYYGNRRMSSAVASCSAALRIQMSLQGRYRRLVTWQDERYKAILCLRDLMKMGRKEVPLLELGKFLPCMTEEHCVHFYRRVRDQEMAAKQTRSKAEEYDEELAFTLVKIEKQLAKINPNAPPRSLNSGSGSGSGSGSLLGSRHRDDDSDSDSDDSTESILEETIDGEDFNLEYGFNRSFKAVSRKGSSNTALMRLKSSLGSMNMKSFTMNGSMARAPSASASPDSHIVPIPEATVRVESDASP